MRNRIDSRSDKFIIVFFIGIFIVLSAFYIYKEINDINKGQANEEKKVIVKKHFESKLAKDLDILLSLNNKDMKDKKVSKEAIILKDRINKRSAAYIKKPQKTIHKTTKEKVKKVIPKKVKKGKVVTSSLPESLKGNKKYFKIASDIVKMKKLLILFFAIKRDSSKIEDMKKLKKQIAENYFEIAFFYFAYCNNYFLAKKNIELAIKYHKKVKFVLLKNIIFYQMYHYLVLNRIQYKAYVNNNWDLIMTFRPEIRNEFLRHLYKGRSIKKTDFLSKVKKIDDTVSFPTESIKKKVEIYHRKFPENPIILNLKATIAFNDCKYKEAENYLKLAAKLGKVKSMLRLANHYLHKAKVLNFVEWNYKNYNFFYYHYYGRYEEYKKVARKKENTLNILKAWHYLEMAAMSYSFQAYEYMHIIFTSGLFEAKYYDVLYESLRKCLKAYTYVKPKYGDVYDFLLQIYNSNNQNQKKLVYNEQFIKKVEKKLKIKTSYVAAFVNFFMATLYLKNKKTITKGLKELEELSNSCWQADYTLAHITYHNKYDVRQDYKKYIFLLFRTLNNSYDNPKISYEIAEYYLNYENDLNVATKYYDEALNLGNIIAGYKLGNFYKNGFVKRGVVIQDNERAMRYFDRVAEKYPPAMYEKGLLLIKKQEIKEGQECIRLAAASGYPEAVEYLKKNKNPK